mgnify:CR=1 FL=1
MENNETEIIVTMDTILSIFSRKSEEKKLKEIKNAVVSQLLPDNNDLFDERRVQIEADVERLIKADKKLGDASLLTVNKGKYKQRKTKSLPGGADALLQSNDFTGRAGECAVMSELLFRGYNVNRMMVDGGIDLVAFKDSSYFFYQVKTVGVKDGCIQASIPIDNFEKNRGYAPQMRYAIVGRYFNKDGVQLNHYFVFGQDDIEKEMFDKTIKRGSTYISIKIRFHERTGDPILYDGENEHSASWYRNHF